MFVPASGDFIAGRVSPDHDILWASHIAGREHGMHKKALSCGELCGFESASWRQLVESCP
ncbi:hypothetical protein DNTS_032519 [Danionella cerebrum]|uniref:Uncharacterized protein n=1 Tax=Danionella cerebrum TaxID=2873325 RepID=A0A553PZZ0_9TELE|nr:hypothetical protein DNTS_032519 [Danionella translucida]